MKRLDLIKKIEVAGYYFKEHGGNHDKYTNGVKTVQIPRHREINEKLAKAIIKQCGL